MGREAACAHEDLRVLSSIPRDAAGKEHWRYPSPRQFREALLRRGRHVDDGQAPLLVSMHNAVNEHTWDQVCRWQHRLAALRSLFSGVDDRAAPALLRFMGRPRDPSPRSLLYRFVWGRRRPFDRHDWWVQGGDGAVTRYVIDFYAGNDRTPSVFIDVRPAVDSFSLLLCRVALWVLG